MSKVLQLVNGLPTMVNIPENYVVSLNDATSSGNVFTYANSYKFAVITYSIERATITETGRLQVSQKNSQIAMTQDSSNIGDTGITLYADLNGSNVEINYSSTATGQGATFTYSINKW